MHARTEHTAQRGLNPEGLGPKGTTVMTGNSARRRRHCVHRAGRHPWRLPDRVTRHIAGLLVVAGLVAVAIATTGTIAWAQDAPTDPGVSSIPEVVNRMRIWLVGILVAVSTLFLTIGGFRYLWSNGDPGEVEKAKTALRNAAIGYALAILAPLFVTIVTGFVS
jgi:hypothetical protein